MNSKQLSTHQERSRREYRTELAAVVRDSRQDYTRSVDDSLYASVCATHEIRRGGRDRQHGRQPVRGRRHVGIEEGQPLGLTCLGAEITCAGRAALPLTDEDDVAPALRHDAGGVIGRAVVNDDDASVR